MTTLAELKAGRVADVMRLREVFLQNGTTVGALGARLKTDAHTLVVMVFAKFYFDANPGGSFEWPTAAGTWATVDAAKLTSAAQAVIGHLRTCNATAKSLQAQIEAAADEAAVLAVDITAGWPT